MRYVVCRRCGNSLLSKDNEEGVQNGFCKEDWEMVCLFVNYFREEASQEELIAIATEGITVLCALAENLERAHHHRCVKKCRNIVVDRFRTKKLPALLKKVRKILSARPIPRERIRVAERIKKVSGQLRWKEGAPAGLSAITPVSCVRPREALLSPVTRFTGSEEKFLYYLRHKKGIAITQDEGRILIAYRRRFMTEHTGSANAKSLVIQFFKKHAILTMEDIRRLRVESSCVSRPSALA